MGILGISGVEVEHCIHCAPSICWLEYGEGKAPELSFRGFPPSGHLILSKKRALVFCSRCTLGNPLEM
jgi:hypothetical protein